MAKIYKTVGLGPVLYTCQNFYIQPKDNLSTETDENKLT